MQAKGFSKLVMVKHSVNMDLEQGPEKGDDKEKYHCCSKRFTALSGLKIAWVKLARVEKVFNNAD